ncbi:protein DpdD [Blastococcus sp. SYSU DS0510]
MTQVDVEAFLHEFFGPGNDLKLREDWRQVPVFRSTFLPFVEDLEAGPGRPLLLPREVAGNSLLYAWAWSPAQGRRLAEALRSFIGPTWSDFTGIVVKPRPGDPVERALQDLGEGVFFRLRVDRERFSDVWRAANLLREVWAMTPVRLVEQQLPLGRLLRDFDMALAAHDEQLSADVLEKIDQSRRLQPVNVAFLKIRRLRVLGDLEGVLRLPELPEVSDLRLPLAVRDTLLAAAQAVHLEQFKASCDADAAVVAARDHLGHLRRLLDDVRLPPSEPAVDALLALVAVEADSALGRRLHQDLRERATPWQQALLGRIVPRPEVDERDAAARVQAALMAGRPGEAWLDLDRVGEPTARLQLAVQCALTLQDAHISREVHSQLAAVSEEARKAVLSPPWFAQTWADHLTQVASRGPHDDVVEPCEPRSWGEMLSALLAGEIEDPVDVVEDHATGWPAPGTQDRVLDELLLQFDPSSSAFSDLTLIVPRLLEAVSDESPAPRTASTCVTVLALSEEQTPAVVRAMLEALRLAVASGPAQYADILDVVRSVLPRTLGVPTADWFFDAVDQLLSAPAPQEDARAAFCSTVLTRLHGLRRRLVPPQRHLGQLLSEDLGLQLNWLVGVEDGGGVDERVDLRRTVLLYSLQSAVLARVKKALEALWANLTVHVSDEHDGSSRLRTQVQASDVLVLATRRATHAATGAIERWRASDSVLVYAPGAGSASMLASAVSALTDP